MSTTGKGVYPYSVCNNAHVMKNIVNFPPINKFSNDWTNTSCTPKNYQFVIDVYKSFNCKNLD